MTEWRLIPGHETYEVSDEGQVRRLDGLVLKGTNRGGRLTVHLDKQLCSIARLVLLAFVGPQPPDKEARHYPDRDILNNRLDNLSWASRLINQRDRKEHLTDTQGERHGMSILTWEKVRMIRTIKNWPYGVKGKIAKALGIAPSTLSQIIDGTRWKE